MNWIPWPESIKKRTYRYVLQNYVGEFLQEKIRLEQLSVDLFNGTGSVSDLSLNLSSLNQQLYTFGVPLEVIDGYVRNITIQIPWSALLTDSSQLTLTGLELSVQMAEKRMSMQGMCESLYQTACTMTTSIEIAEKVVENATEEIEGLDALSAYIEKVLSRVQVTLMDTVLRVETEKGDTKIELRIKRIEYMDQTEDKEADDGLPSIYLKKVVISGVTFWHEKDRSSNVSTSINESTPDRLSQKSEKKSASDQRVNLEEKDDDHSNFSLIGEIMGSQEIKVKIQPREATYSPKLSLDASLQAISFFVCPNQIHSILDLLSSLSASSSNKRISKPIRPEEYNRIETQIFDDDKDSISDGLDTFEFRPGQSLDPQFFSLYGSGHTDKTMGSSMRSSISSNASSVSQASVSNRHEKSHRVKRSSIHTDSSVSGYQYSFKLSSISICILHNDPTNPMELARDYFSKMKAFYNTGLVSRQIREIADELHQILEKDRLLLFAFPISGSVNQSPTYSREELHMNIQSGQIWFWEHLYSDSCPKHKKGLQIPLLKFRVDTNKSIIEALPEVGHCIKLSMNQSQKSAHLWMELGDAIVDIDMSIVDRLSRLLSYTPKHIEIIKSDPQSHASLIAELSSPDVKKIPFNFLLSAENLHLAVRIPIPDKRDELHRAPWYQRRIRDEMIKIHLKALNLSMPRSDFINTSVKEILLYFCESDVDLNIPPLISLLADDHLQGRVGYPQINILTKYKPLSSMYQSYYDEFTNTNPQTVFSNQQTTYGDERNQQSVEIPAKPAEMMKFKRNLEDSSTTYVNLIFPLVEIEIHSRQYYEKLFNRVAWDLAMWEPSPCFSQPTVPTKQVFFELDGEFKNENEWYGVGKATQFGLEVDIGHGNIKLNCRESSYGTGPVVNLNLSHVSIFFAAKYLSGIADYLYISVGDIFLTHRPESEPEDIAWVYRSNPTTQNGESPMIAVAVKIENEETTRALAHFTVGITIHRVTMRFRLIEAGLAPWDHVGLIFKIHEELPIGYTPPAYITSLHLQLNEVQVDYRPLFLPTSSLLSISSFFISTMIRPNMDKAPLSMIGEDICLYLTNRPPQPTQQRVDIILDSFVKLIRINQVEIMIRIDPGSSLKSDIIIRADIALECCADSCAAVARLLRYVSVDGDFQSEFESSSGNTVSSVSSKASQQQDIEDEDADPMSFSSSIDSKDRTLTNLSYSVTELADQTSIQHNLLDAMDDDDFLIQSRKDDPDLPRDSPIGDLEDFVDLEAEPGIGFLKTGSVPVVRNFHPFEIKENHFRLPYERKDKLNPPLDFPKPDQRILVKELNFSWKMYAGVDFPIAFEPMRMDRTLRGMQMPRSKSQRESKCVVDLIVSKFRLRHETFQDPLMLSRIAITLDELEILDRLEMSNINKLLHRDRFYHSPNSNPIIFFKTLLMKPDQDNGEVLMDAKVRLSVEPMRVNLDQDTGLHLVKYFTDLSQLSIQDYSVEKSMSSISDPGEVQDEPKEIFFKEINFSPDLTIRIDYQGKRVETSDYGTLMGLVIGLGQLNCSQITFKRYLNKNGILSVERLLTNILNEWGSDIKRNQIPQIVAGVGPFHSIRQLLSGFVELFSAPVEAYKRDGRVLRGVRKGASAFSNSTAVAALELSGRLFDWIDFAASLTYDMVSTSTSVSNKISRADRPADFREGISNAYGVVHDGMKQHYREVGKTIESGWDQRGFPGAVGSALSLIPSSLARPVLLSAKAGSNVLAGARNQLRPEARKEDLDKYKK